MQLLTIARLGQSGSAPGQPRGEITVAEWRSILYARTKFRRNAVHALPAMPEGPVSWTGTLSSLWRVAPWDWVPCGSCCRTHRRLARRRLVGCKIWTYGQVQMVTL